MCKLKSAIILKDRIFMPDYDSHSEMRCKTLKKGVNVPVPMLVTHPDDKGYEIVKSCGYEYGTDDI